MKVEKEHVDILPTDVLYQVLSRLPSKTLLTLRCVSKQWGNFISDPYFVSLQNNYSSKKALVLQVNLNIDNKVKITLVDPLNVSSTESFLLSFEGVFSDCTVYYCTGLLLFYWPKHYTVCNPSTRECFTTNHNLDSKQELIRLHYLNRYHIGFGFLSSTSQHKFVIPRFTWKSNKNSSISTEQSKSPIVTLPNKWAAGSLEFISGDSLNLRNWVLDIAFDAICVSGIIYWQLECIDKHVAIDLRKILTFDLEVEEYRVITGPLHYVNTFLLKFFLVELKGKVCLVDLWREKPVFDIWVLRDHRNEIWVKEYTVDCSVMNGVDRDVPRLFEWSMHPTPLQIIGDCEGEKAILVKSHDGCFYNYNLKTKTFTKLGEYRSFYYHEFVHHDSIFPVPSA